MDEDAIPYDSGRFTLDPGRAAEMLKRFALADPHRWILKLVQWAVRSGARQVQVECSRQSVSLCHDGRPLPGETARSVSQLLPAAGPPELLHLLVGLQACCGLQPASVEVWGERGWDYLTGRPAAGGPLPHPCGVRVEGLPAPSPLSEGLRAIAPLVSEPLTSQSWSWLGSLIGRTRREEPLLSTHGAPCPVPLTVNGRLVNRPWFGLPCGAEVLNGRLLISRPPWSRLVGLRFCAEGDFLVGPALPGQPVCDVGWENERAGRLSVLGRWRGTSSGKYVARTQLFWVQDGIIVETETVQQPPGNYQALLIAPGVDASQFRVVGGDALRSEVMEWFGRAGALSGVLQI